MEQRAQSGYWPSKRLRLLALDDLAWRRRGPTEAAVRAFRADTATLRRMPGGAGHAWTDGRVVLKPIGCVPEHNWVCDVYAQWTATEVRVPEPVRPAGDSGADWSVEGWGAHVFVCGADLELPAELERVKEASDAFHACTAHLPRPPFLDDREDPWAFGDRMAWEDAEPFDDPETRDLIERLRGHLAPTTESAQVIHGDVLPNVLHADGAPLAVIDWPPYFRPAAMANAIAVTDAVTFRGAPLSLLDKWASGADWDQLLLRALLYRLGPTNVFAFHRRLRGSLVHHVKLLEPVVEAVRVRAG